MFELILSFLAAILVLYFKSTWVSLFSTVILAAVVFPGIYSMLFGAPFIPTSKKRIAAIIELGNFGGNDSVYDLGCGDGRVIREVALKDVKMAIGYEFSIPTYFFAKIKTMIGRGKEIIKFGNFWKKDFSDADALICFFLESTMKEFERKIWPLLKPGARVISNEFKMKNVEPDKTSDGVYLYVKK